MPFNGAGVFSRIYSWTTDALNGLSISPSRMDTDSNDIAAGLTLCLTKNGQSTPTANLPMGGYKLTGLGPGSASSDSITYGQFTTGGATIVGYSQGSTGSVNRTVAAKLQENVSVLDLGADPTNTAEAGTIINQAISDLSAAGGGILYVPPGIYKHAVQLVFKNNVWVIGAGWGATRFNYTGTVDQAIITNPINSSTVAGIKIAGIYFNGPSITTPHGNLWDTGSSLVDVEDCFFNAGFVGLIFDQSELWTVLRCYFGGTNGVWFVNGPDRNGGEAANPYFTNRIKFDGCQFNVTGIAVADDGGMDHTFHTCNFNAGTYYARVCGTYGFNVLGGEIESATTGGFQLVTTKWVSSAALTSGTTLSVCSAAINTTAGSLFSFAASSCNSFTFNENTLNTPNTLFTGLANCLFVESKGNVQLNAGGTGYSASVGYAGLGLNNQFDGKVGTMTWNAAGTAPSLAGAGSGLNCVMSRIGRKVTLDVTLTFGAGTTFGTGNWEFGLPTAAPTAQASDTNSAAFYQCAGAFYTGLARMYLFGNYILGFAANNTGAAVQSNVPAAWVASNANFVEFSLTYLSNDWIN